MFDQVEDDLSPVLEWSWRLKTDIKVVLGSAALDTANPCQQVVRDGVGWPHYGWMPDGHMSVLWDNTTARWLTFYPNHESFRWEGGGRVWPLLTSADLY